MAITWNEYTDASLTTVLASLTTNGIGFERVKAIEHDGTAWHAVYVVL